MRVAKRVAVGLAVVALAGCGSGSGGTITAGRSRQLARWTPLVRAVTPIDVAGGRSDGAPVVAADGMLYLLRHARRLVRFAPAYQGAGGETYVAVPAPGHRGCSFGADTVYAIRLHGGRGITRITARGEVSRFATITAPGLINGIAFDETGRFHYRLLVTINHRLTTTVDAIDCRGRVTTLTSTAPRVEGGIAVAPETFGPFAGDLIAPDELSGRIYGITPQGTSRLLIRSGLPFGQDTGVESETFLTADGRGVLLVADRLTPGNPHPGDDLVLKLPASRLMALGVHARDLLVTTEGGALTEAVSCGRRGCGVRYVAKGPARAHIEGHIAIGP